MANPSGMLGNPGARLGVMRLGSNSGSSGHVYVVSAATTIVASATSTGRRSASASATTSIALTTTSTGGRLPHAVAVSATTTITLSPRSSGVRPSSTRIASASTVFAVSARSSGTSIYGGPRTATVSASSRMAFQVGANDGLGHILFASACNKFVLATSGSGGPNVFRSVSARTQLALATSSYEYVSPIHVSAATRLAVSAAAGLLASRTKFGSATNQISLLSQADSDGQIRTVAVSASDAIAISATVNSSQIRTVYASARTSLNIYGNLSAAGARAVSASTRIAIAPMASRIAAVVVSAATSISIHPSAQTGGRIISVSAVTAMGMSSADSEAAHFDPASGSVRLSFGAQASGSIGYNGGHVAIGFRDLATASVQLLGGGSIPGGDANAGLRAVAYPNVSGEFPFSYAETPSGLLLLANGVDPMLRWDGLSGTADTAGVQPPGTAIAMGGQAVGTLVGMRYAYCRFVDRNGNPSTLSPISNAVNLGRDGLIEDIAINLSTGVATIQATGHGLSPTDVVVIQGVGGLSISGSIAVTTIDPDHFALTAIRVTSGAWTGGGSWTWGVKTVVYQSVPIPLETKVARRQILRNLDGSADVFYVDIDTTDLTSTTLSSDRDDESLSACESVPLATGDDLPYASRYAPPPSHKSIIASHSGRMFACGEVTISLGNVIPRFGSTTVTGIGTAWPGSLVGRFLYVSGATQPYEIAGVNTVSQTITLTIPYADTSQPYATYAIRPAPGERRLVYYTEPGLPESWPPWNAFAIPEENDEIVGMMTRTGFLYFIEKRHIHRFTMQNEPSEGQDFASINRGCINNRCLVQVENTTYLLDEAGIHAFDGGQATEAISTPIQTIFQSDGLLGGLMVDWTADSTLWHASHDPVRNTIRWFVQMGGYDGIFHAISYDYRQQRWWIEQYPTAITSSTTGVVGYRRSLVGTDARRVVVLGEGSLDLVADAGPGYGGSVSAADSTSLTDALAAFPANLAGAPVSITSGTGRRQQAIICDNTSTSLTIVTPWGTIPDGTSTYQVGGVNWSWRSGWFEYVSEEENENPRDVMLTYQPTQNPAAVDLQIFNDHSAEARLSSYGTSQDGVETTANDPNVSFNLQTRASRAGWSLQRFGGHSEVYGYGEQYLQILLAGVQCSESIRIFQVTLNGVRTNEDD